MLTGDAEREPQERFDAVFVIADLGGGGSQRVLTLLLNSMTNRGRKLAVATFTSAEEDFFEIDDRISRYEIGGISKSSNWVIGVYANFRRILKLRQVLIESKTPIAVAFIAPTNVLLTLAAVGLGIKVAVSERNDPARQSFGFLWDVLRRWCYPFADLVIANSAGAVQVLQEWVHPSRLRFIRNPISRPVLSDQNILQEPTVLAVGRLHHQKGYDILLNAIEIFFSEHLDWRLVVLGEGDERSNLQKQARDLSVESRVSWLGLVENPWPYYQAADIFTMPSRYEGTPNALIEAMSIGLPCVVSDALPGALDLVQTEISGLVVPVEDSVNLAEAIGRLAADSKLRKRLGENARKAIQNNWRESVLDQWERILDL